MASTAIRRSPSAIKARPYPADSPVWSVLTAATRALSVSTGFRGTGQRWVSSCVLSMPYRAIPTRHQLAGSLDAVQQTVAGQHMEAGAGNPPFLQLPHHPVKRLQLAAGESLVLRPVGIVRTEMGEEPRYLQVLHPADTGQLFHLLAPFSQPVHAGIHADVDTQPPSVAAKLKGIGIVHYRLTQTVAPEQRELPGWVYPSTRISPRTPPQRSSRPSATVATQKERIPIRFSSRATGTAPCP